MKLKEKFQDPAYLAPSQKTGAGIEEEILKRRQEGKQYWDLDFTLNLSITDESIVHISHQDKQHNGSDPFLIPETLGLTQRKLPKNCCFSNV